MMKALVYKGPGQQGILEPGDAMNVVMTTIPGVINA
jgi:hypothetical protein